MKILMIAPQVIELAQSVTMVLHQQQQAQEHVRDMVVLIIGFVNNAT
jgi:hypothetical protein